MEQIGGKLKDLLKKRKLQSKELGERMGLSKVTISHWTTNFSNPSLEQLEQINQKDASLRTYFLGEADHTHGKKSVQT